MFSPSLFHHNSISANFFDTIYRTPQLKILTKDQKCHVHVHCCANRIEHCSYAPPPLHCSVFKCFSIRLLRHIFVFLFLIALIEPKSIEKEREKRVHSLPSSRKKSRTDEKKTFSSSSSLNNIDYPMKQRRGVLPMRFTRSLSNFMSKKRGSYTEKLSFLSLEIWHRLIKKTFKKVINFAMFLYFCTVHIGYVLFFLTYCLVSRKVAGIDIHDESILNRCFS